MRSIVFACHDAGGTIPPVIALTEALVDAGHDVAILSQPSVRERAEKAGATHVPFSSLPDYRRRTPLEEQLDLVGQAILSPETGEDLRRAADARSADVVVVDANLAGALAVAETLEQPSAVLLHSMYATFVDTWFGELWPVLADAVNTTRAAYGLAEVNGWPDVFAPHELLLSVVPPSFDAGGTGSVGSLRHVGFLVPDGPADAAVDFPPGDEPTVLVGLSTTYQRHETLLHTIVDALGRLAVRAVVTTAGQVDIAASPGHVRVVEHVPHAALLARTDVMVTHAGLGSVAAALSFGVPLVCTPIARDQPLNAARVADLGAGIGIAPHAGADEIAAAIASVLGDSTFREAAARAAEESRAAGGAKAAVALLDGL